MSKLKIGMKVLIYGFCHFDNDWDMHDGTQGVICGIDSIDTKIIQVKHKLGRCWVHEKQCERINVPKDKEKD